MRVVVAMMLALLVTGSEPAGAVERGSPALSVVVDVADATVEVDGRVRGKTPLPEPLALAPGEHTLKVWKTGHAAYLDVVRIKASGVTRLSVELLPVAAVLLVETEPDDADVFIGGEFAGESPLELELQPGEHLVRAALPGRLPAERRVVLTLGVVAREVFTLAPVPESRQPPSRPVWRRGWFWSGAAALAATAAYFLVPRPQDAASGADRVIEVPSP